MEPIDAYHFCLKCGGKLVPKGKQLDCSVCGFVFYLNPTPTNAVIIENALGEILLVKRKVNPQKGLWDLPGGFIQSGESFEESVKREIREELGIEITITSYVGAYADRYLFQGILDYTLGITVTAKILSGEIHAADDVSEYRFFPKNDVLAQDIAFAGIREGLQTYLQL